MRGAVDGRAEAEEVIVERDLAHAEAEGVFVGNLHVKEGVAAGAEVMPEGDEARAGCAGGGGAVVLKVGEHALGEEGGADGEAVDAADERGFGGIGVLATGGRAASATSWQPSLDGVGVAGFVEQRVDADEGFVEPGSAARGAGAGAGADDGLKGVVGGEGEARAIERAADGARHAEGVVLKREDGAGVGAIPVDGAGGGEGAAGEDAAGELGHGERALAIGVEEHPDDLFWGAGAAHVV